jgi:uncharacterized protein
MSIVNKIKPIILDLCSRQESPFQEPHVRYVVYHAKELAVKLRADVEICEVAAWLHDIEKIKGIKEDHHIKGAAEAKKILKSMHYPEDRIARVCSCILCHSTDENHIPNNLEQKIVASADALAHFEMPVEFIYLRQKKGEDAEQAREWLLKKYEKTYKKMMPEAKKMIKKKYDAMKIALKR